jgi:hypothetical protein
MPQQWKPRSAKIFRTAASIAASLFALWGEKLAARPMKAIFVSRMSAFSGAKVQISGQKTKEKTIFLFPKQLQ